MISFPLQQRRRRGFTLIELLTIIGIIGVLAALVFPAVGQMRGSANRTKVLSNLRKLQSANVMYAQENDGRYVPVWDNVPEGYRLQWYADYRFTQAMLGNASGQWGLPDKMTDPRVAKRADGTVNTAIQYAMNTQQIGGGWSAAGPTGYRVSDIATPSSTIVFITANNWLFDASPSSINRVEYRNGDGKAEAVRFDGSVILVTKAQLSDGSATNRSLLNPKE